MPGEVGGLLHPCLSLFAAKPDLCGQRTGVDKTWSQPWFPAWGSTTTKHYKLLNTFPSFSLPNTRQEIRPEDLASSGQRHRVLGWVPASSGQWITGVRAESPVAWQELGRQTIVWEVGATSMLRRCEFVLALVLNLDSVEEVHSLTCTSRAQAASQNTQRVAAKILKMSTSSAKKTLKASTLLAHVSDAALPAPWKQWSASPTTCGSAESSGSAAAAAAWGAAAAGAAGPCAASQSEPPSPPELWGCSGPPAWHCPWQPSGAPPPSRGVLLLHSAGWWRETVKSRTPGGNFLALFGIYVPRRWRTGAGPLASGRRASRPHLRGWCGRCRWASSAPCHPSRWIPTPLPS